MAAAVEPSGSAITPSSDTVEPRRPDNARAFGRRAESVAPAHDRTSPPPVPADQPAPLSSTLQNMSIQLPESTPSSSRRSPSPRPSLRGTRSFSRLEPADGESDPLQSSLARLQTDTAVLDPADASASPQQLDDDDDHVGTAPGSSVFPEGFDELPPELVNISDRFMESLRKPIHPSPPTITQLSDMFQQFYSTAFQAVGDHISNSYMSLSSKKPRSSSGGAQAPTQMLSLSEISQKKRDRKMLEAKRLALEEAVERRTTEGVYDRIYRHKTTDDEARDESLRSKMAALKVVGVNLSHLGVELGKEQPNVDAELQPAIDALIEMSSKKSPLGKLMRLKEAHKAVVDCLSLHVSSASADFILPTLIYTLIISPPTPEFNVISDLYFIQRFRAQKAVDGEAAYCLTNLEAAISFLETVDLATLKMEEGGDPLSTDKPSAPAASETDPEKPAPARQTPPPLTVQTKSLGGNTSASSSTTSLVAPLQGGRGRKLSYLTPIDIAANAVSSADQGLRNIGSSLEGSYKFLFGKLNTQGQDAPKTLEDARKLIDSPTVGPEAGFLAAIDGVLKRKLSDASLRSAMSEKAKSATERPGSSAGSPAPAPPPAPQRATTMPVVDQVGESVKNFGNQLKGFAGMGALRGFSRSATSTTSATPVAATGTGVGSGKEKGLGIVVKDENGIKTHARTESGTVVDLLSTFPELAPELGETGERVPVRVEKRWLDVEDVGQLRLTEVAELLDAYRKLAGEVRQRGMAAEE